MDMKELANKGQKIYERRYKKKLEKSHFGQFVAIDIFSEDHFLGSTAEEAAKKAQEARPNGFFHLMRIGYNGVYRMGTFLFDENYSIF